MSEYTFHRLLQHIGSNGPRSNAEVDHEIVSTVKAVHQMQCRNMTGTNI